MEQPPTIRLAPDANGTNAMPAAQAAQLAQTVMRRQLALSVRVAIVFLALLLGLPLANWLAPHIMGVRIGGFTLTWLFLGVLFYPLTWGLSAYFIRHSDRIEGELTAEFGRSDAADSAS